MFFFLLYVCLFDLDVNMSTMCVSYSHKGPKSMPDPLKFQVQVVVSHPPYVFWEVNSQFCNRRK